MAAADPSNAIAVAEHPVPIGTIRTGMNQMLQKALTLVDPGSLAEGRLLSQHGWELARLGGDYAAAQDAFNRAMTIARDTGDEGLELNTLTRSADVGYLQLRLVESSMKSMEGVELAVRANDTYNEATARLSATRAFMLQGEGDEAQTQASALITLAERVRNRFWQLTALIVNSQLACLRGDWSKQRNLAEEALALTSQ
ncbi:MAG: hypothetical protein ACE5Q6_23885, partial [Dehalococcoidia bacterium]